MPNKSFILKRVFDIIMSILLLLFIWWFIVIIWLISLVIHKSNGFFFQKRVGYHGNIFYIIKFKTMMLSSSITTTVTTFNDIRITNFGHFIRRFKIDEIPQIINIIKGDMSFVGPRPDVPGYADLLQGKDRVILSVRPGITGPAQLAYKDEENLLGTQKYPIQYNDEVIWPDKVRINKEYVENYTFSKDIYYMLQTILS